MEACLSKIRAVMAVAFAVVMVACVSLATGAIAATGDGDTSGDNPTNGAGAGGEGCGSIAILLDNSGSFVGYSPQVKETVGRLVDTFAKTKTKFMFANIRPESAMKSVDYDLTSEAGRTEFKNKVMASYEKGVSDLAFTSSSSENNWQNGTEAYAFKHVNPGEWKNVVYVTDGVDFGLMPMVLDHIAAVKSGGATVTVTRTKEDTSTWREVPSKPGMFYPTPVEAGEGNHKYETVSKYYVNGINVDPKSEDRNKSLMSAFDKIIDDKVCRIDPNGVAATPSTPTTPTTNTPTSKPTSNAGVGGACEAIAVILDNSGSFLDQTEALRPVVGKLVDSFVKSGTKFMFTNIRKDSAMPGDLAKLKDEGERTKFKNAIVEDFDKGVNQEAGETESSAFLNVKPGEYKNIVYISDADMVGMNENVVSHIRELKAKGANIVITGAHDKPIIGWEMVDGKTDEVFPWINDPSVTMDHKYANDPGVAVKYVVYHKGDGSESQPIMGVVDKIINDNVCDPDAENPSGEPPAGTTAPAPAGIPTPTVTATVHETETAKPDPQPTVTETVRVTETKTIESTETVKPSQTTQPAQPAQPAAQSAPLAKTGATAGIAGAVGVILCVAGVAIARARKRTT